MGGHKKQHYVPKSYLKAWSTDGRRIWMFDKHQNISKHVSLSDVAQTKFFNDAFRRSRGKVTDGEAPDLVERQFQAWENQFITMRQVALDIAANRGMGSLKDRQKMATCAAVQLLRTDKTREALLNECFFNQGNSRPRLIDWLEQPLREKMLKEPEFARRHISLIQSWLLWNSELVPQIATELYYYLWVIAKNSTQIPFYTSDAPIAALTHTPGKSPFDPRPRSRNHRKNKLNTLKGLFCEQPTKCGLELIFPVTPDCALMMFHPLDFEATLGDKQGKVLVVGEQTVSITNVAISSSALRQVFSSTHDFSVAALVVGRQYNS